MNGKQLKNSILQWAIQGKLVPQDPNDEPASVLLEKIRAEKQRLIKEGKLKKQKNESIIFRGDDNSHYEKFLATGEVKCIDDEIPFELPKGWEWCRVSTISSHVTDGDHQAPPKTSKGIPFVVISDISQGQNEIKTTRFVPKLYFDALPTERKPRKGDILFSVTGSYGIAVENTFGVDFCFQRHIALVRPLIWSKYLCFAMLSPFFKSQCDDTATGMAQKTVGLESLRNFLIPLPPLSEQKRIVARIEELMPLVDRYSNAQDKLDKLNATINEALKKSILQEAIQGKLVPQIESEGTAQDLLEQIKAEKQRLVKEGKLKKSALTDSVIFKGDDNSYYERIGKTTRCIDDEIPFEIPDSWCWTRINTIAISQLGKTLDRGKDIIGNEYPYLCSVNVYWDGIDLSKIKTFKLRNEELAKYRLLKGDLLVCEGGDYGRCCVWDRDEEMYYQNALHRIRFYCGLLPTFYKYIFELYRYIGYIVGQGQTIKHFTYESMKSILFPLPPLSEQQRIVSQIERLFEKLR